MSKTIDFTHGNDSGESGEESITPIENGEQADKFTLNRPVEVLRHRTEILRAEANQARWVRDADRALSVWLEEDSTVLWEGAADGVSTGKFVAEGSLVVASLLNPGESRGDSDYEFAGTASTHPSRRATAVISLSEDSGMLASANILQFQGANEITMELIGHEGYGALTIEVTGSDVDDPAVQPGRDNIRVHFDTDVPPIVSAVIDAVNSHVTAGSLVTLKLLHGSLTDEVNSAPKVQLQGGFDNVMLRISATTLAAAPALAEGDCLALWRDSVSDRRKNVPESASHIVGTGGSATLINLTDHPDRVANAIPLGRVINGNFIWINGYVLIPNSVTHRLSSGRVSDEGFSVLEGTEIQAVLDSADAALQEVVGDIASHVHDGGDHSKINPNSHIDWQFEGVYLIPGPISSGGRVTVNRDEGEAVHRIHHESGSMGGWRTEFWADTLRAHTGTVEATEIDSEGAGLTTDGTVNVGGGLNVQSGSSFQGVVDILGIAGIQDLVVLGGAEVRGNLDVDEVLHVKGSTTLDQPVLIKGNTTLQQLITVHGETTLQQDLQVNANAEVSGTLTNELHYGLRTIRTDSLNTLNVRDSSGGDAAKLSVNNIEATTTVEATTVVARQVPKALCVIDDDGASNTGFSAVFHRRTGDIIGLFHKPGAGRYVVRPLYNGYDPADVSVFVSINDAKAGNWTTVAYVATGTDGEIESGDVVIEVYDANTLADARVAVQIFAYPDLS